MELIGALEITTSQKIKDVYHSFGGCDVMVPIMELMALLGLL